MTLTDTRCKGKPVARPELGRDRRSQPAERLAISLDEAPHAFQRHCQLVARRTVRAAHETITRLPKRAARHHGYPLFEEEPLGEVVGAQTGARDGREGVERALWLVGR